MRPRYPRPPVGSTQTLARLLGFRPTDLAQVAHRDDLYRPAGYKPKPDGTRRPIFEAREPLKTIQGRIKSRLLKVVEYPSYLQGALPQRDYVTDAEIHSGTDLLINLDITHFYPHCSAKVIDSIWRHFFCFPPDVAYLLTLLTCRNGCLPQGASPSSYLGNLAFWGTEDILVLRLKSHGMTYTRFVDDITVSAGYRINRSQKEYIIRQVLGMISPKGFSLHRGKLQISGRSTEMTVHNLNVKPRRPTILGRKRDQIRAKVRNLEQMAAQSRSGKHYRDAYLSTRGSLALLKRFHPSEANKLLERVRGLHPVHSDLEVTVLRRQITSLCRCSAPERASYDFTKRAARAHQEVSSLARSRPREALGLRKILKDCGI